MVSRICKDASRIDDLGLGCGNGRLGEIVRLMASYAIWTIGIHDAISRHSFSKLRTVLGS